MQGIVTGRLAGMRILYLTLCIWVLDQCTKILVKGIELPFLGIKIPGMEYGSSIHLLGNWLNITFIENPNMAFGLELAGKTFLTFFAIAASIGIVYYLWKHKHAPFSQRLALSLILAGALGNLMDRVFYGVIFEYAPLFQGNVVDFIDFDLFMIHIGSGAFKFWPIFNVADSAVSIGVVLLLFMSRTKQHADNPTQHDLDESMDVQSVQPQPE